LKHLIRAASLAALCCASLPALSETSFAAYQAVREALVAVWDELPLTVMNATLVTGTPKGFGQFERRASAAFKLDEPVTVYAELYGYGVESIASGGYARRLAADLSLLDESGAIRANQVDFWSGEEVFAHRPLEMHLSFSATLSAFEPGSYTLRFTIHDLTKPAETSFDIPIQLGVEKQGS
jgi:hypothetical protein